MFSDCYLTTVAGLDASDPSGHTIERLKRLLVEMILNLPRDLFGTFSLEEFWSFLSCNFFAPNVYSMLFLND